MTLINTILNGDCKDELAKLPENYISACITDPPYNYEFIGHKWDQEEIQRRKDKVKENSSTLVKNIPYGSGLSGGVRNPRWYKKNRDNKLKFVFSEELGKAHTESVSIEKIKEFYDNIDGNTVKAVIDMGTNTCRLFIAEVKNGNLKGKLKEIAASLDEESNPVLMIAKYKQKK